MHMNKKAMLAKLDEIESAIKEIREMLQEGPAGEKDGEARAAGEGGDEKGESTRIVCPKCKSLKIIMHVDKAKVLYYHQGAPIYAKKGVCSQCGTEIPL
jgi:DNA-directed RNA polymerase subunit RPC12/RpoP